MPTSGADCAGDEPLATTRTRPRAEATARLLAGEKYSNAVQIVTMPSDAKVLVDVPARAGLPSVCLERSPAGSYTLLVDQSSTRLTPSSRLHMALIESGWGPIISSEVIVSLRPQHGEPVSLITLREHDVLDPAIIQHLQNALQQIVAAVGCSLEVQERRPTL